MFNRQVEKQIRAGRRLKDEVVALAIQGNGRDGETGKIAIVKVAKLNSRRGRNFTGRFFYTLRDR